MRADGSPREDGEGQAGRRDEHRSDVERYSGAVAVGDQPEPDRADHVAEIGDHAEKTDRDGIHAGGAQSTA